MGFCFPAFVVSLALTNSLKFSIGLDVSYVDRYQSFLCFKGTFIHTLLNALWLTVACFKCLAVKTLYRVLKCRRIVFWSLCFVVVVVVFGKVFDVWVCSEGMTLMKPKPNRLCGQGEISFQIYSYSQDMLQIKWLQSYYCVVSTEDISKC